MKKKKLTSSVTYANGPALSSLNEIVRGLIKIKVNYSQEITIKEFEDGTFEYILIIRT